jgi:hypothetical protein
MSNENKSNAFKAAVVCMILGCVVMLLSLWAVFIYAPLFLAAFILSIVSMAKEKIGGGIAVLLGSIIFPSIIFVVSLSIGLESLSKEMQSFSESTPTETDNVRNDTPEYTDQVEISKFEARYYNHILYGEVPGIRLRLQNNGEKIVKRVEVTVYFKDKNDNVIFERDVTTFNSLSIIEEVSPLRPGYIWQLEDDKFIRVENVPDEWKVGNADIKVTEVDFE